MVRNPSLFQNGMSLKESRSIMIRGMVIDMNDAKLKMLTQVKEFLEGTWDVGFQIREKDRYLAFLLLESGGM